LTILTTRREWLALAAAAGLAAAMAAPAAWAADPAAATIDSLDAGLIDTMKAAKSSGARERFRKLEPVVARAFDFSTMTRFAVGPSWASIPAGQQRELTEGLQRLTVASYVHNFSGFSGQRFEVD